MTEAAQPLAVRRLVALAEAVYSGRVEIEDLRGARVPSAVEALAALAAGDIPVLVDPEAQVNSQLPFVAEVDARMRKVKPETGLPADRLRIGLGPGFTAGVDCHAVVETNRGHRLGRVVWSGAAQDDTATPEAVAGYDADRVLRAPAAGVLEGRKPVGSLIRRGEEVARVASTPIVAPFDGALRGLLHDGVLVAVGDKVGDLDPRQEPDYCRQISDKSLAVGGGVLEALLSRAEIRRLLAGP